MKQSQNLDGSQVCTFTHYYFMVYIWNTNKANLSKQWSFKLKQNTSVKNDISHTLTIILVKERRSVNWYIQKAKYENVSSLEI